MHRAGGFGLEANRPRHRPRSDRVGNRGRGARYSGTPTTSASSADRWAPDSCGRCCAPRVHRSGRIALRTPNYLRTAIFERAAIFLVAEHNR
jgi:hypothetical protein